MNEKLPKDVIKNKDLPKNSIMIAAATDLEIIRMIKNSLFTFLDLIIAEEYNSRYGLYIVYKQSVKFSKLI